ncbi:MAG: PilC/PilY family type IV pilus protein [Sedimenticola sp.]|nr:PilC/PilY family type IV pilus protein [Sedimenticola sp.]
MIKSAGIFRRLRLCGAVTVWTSLSVLAGLPGAVHADGNLGDYSAVPPIISSTSDKPNVLVIIDNSNSMDEDASGAAVGSANSGSKSEIARTAIKNLVTNFTGKLRMGLMAYQQQNVVGRWLDNSPYDASYNPANYDPTFTGARDSTTKRYRMLRPGSTTEYTYYNVALPYYHGSNDPGLFCYSATADASSNFADTGGGCTTSGGPGCDAYRCYQGKTGSSDALPIPFNSGNLEGYSSVVGTYTFVPTDSDVAQGISDFGRHLASVPVGQTWFSNSSPGKGYLHVAIGDLDAAQATLINNKLATSQFATATDTPLRNAGLTPLQGTLQTAKDYFTGVSLPANQGGPTVAPTAGTCGNHDYVVLVTDGLPSTDSSGNPVTSTAAALAATATAAGDLLTNNVKTYVVGFALPYGVSATQLDSIAAAGGTGSAYSASNPTTLAATLNTIFNNILNRTSAGTGAAVVSNSSSGVGALYQALYTPALSTQNPSETSSRSVSWVGRLHSIFVDEYGQLREDSNQNDRLDDYSTDYVISIFYNTSAVDNLGNPVPSRTEVQRYSSTSSTEPIGLATLGASVEIEYLKPIWDAREGLNSVTNYVTQRTYTDPATSGRYIVTNLPGQSTLLDFTAANFPNTVGDNNFRYLGGVAQADAPGLINYIRGYECEDIAAGPARTACNAAYRNRTIDWDLDSTNERWLLSDIIHSTPVTIGEPVANYDIHYNDTTYSDFRQKYAGRRQVIYVGGNDGMLHAFNGGFWDTATSAFLTTDPTTASRTAHPLGTELWAYVPGNLLPHLQWLKDPDYPHVYYVDGTPQVFDVNIFSDDATHPKGWGTIMAVTMRFGGGPFSLDTNGDASIDTVARSAVAVFDITDPEQPPVFLAEIAQSGMGFTTSVPQVVKTRKPGVGNDWANPTQNDWKLVFASGPTNLSDASSNQQGTFYVHDLKLGTTATYSMGAGAVNGFGGDVKVVDWDKDFVDDVVYAGVVTGTPASQGGQIARLQLPTNTVSVLYSPGSPFVSAPNVALDANGDHWLHMGSGRLFTVDDNTTKMQQKFYGVKEPLTVLGAFDWSTLVTTDLSNHTTLQVFADASILPSPFTIATYSVTTYQGVLNAMQGVAGWYKQFDANGTDPSMRSITAAVQVGKVLLYTDYKPSNNVCAPEGTSRLNVVDYRTGTAMPHGALGFNPSVLNGTAFLAPDNIDLGQGIASTPVVHSGSGNGGGSSGFPVTVFTQQTTGEITRTQVLLPPAAGGRQSWRELYLD